MGTIRNLVTETSIPRHRNLIEALFGMKCENSEESNGRIEWTWEAPDGSDFVNLLNDNKDVKFHRNFSSGTAVVRGAQPMSQDQYFWEVKMISPVYGTDMMVGIGTPDASMAQVHDKFISLLGNDKQTWGLSYTGLFHHNGESRSYASRFGQGSIIGVHLDLWNGTLSFYKNKKHLGIASKGLTGKTLYAMASSTAACSGMRIVRSCSFPSSLQFLCCAKLRQIIPDEKGVLKALDVPPGLRQFLDNNLGWFLDPRFNECVLYPSLPKRSWAFALKPSSEDPLLTGGGSEERVDDDDESVIMIGGRPFILQCGRKRASPGRGLPSRLPELSSRSTQDSSRELGSPSSSLPEFGSSSGRRGGEVGEPSGYRRDAGSGQYRRFGEVCAASGYAESSSGEYRRFREVSTASGCGESSSGECPRVRDFFEESAVSYAAQNAEYQRGLLKDFLNETMEAESANYDGDYPRGMLKDFLIEPDASVECLNYDSMDSLDIIEITDEEDAAVESPAKRRCSSYNYIMGLSDPDSESETADL